MDEKGAISIRVTNLPDDLDEMLEMLNKRIRAKAGGLITIKKDLCLDSRKIPRDILVHLLSLVCSLSAVEQEIKQKRGN